MNCAKARWVSLLVLLAVSIVSSASAQDRITDQVAITVVKDYVYAATPDEGLVRIRLKAGEEVLAIEARGLNALVHTSMRLLGFSGGQIKRWFEQRTDIFESVVEQHITSRFILVRTTKHLYGFQGSAGRWIALDINPREELREVLIGEHLAVVITERRAMAFSAFTGGFFTQDLPPEEKVIHASINDNIAILTTPARQLIFRSGLAVWTELR
jgi:hypothetical protein